MNKATTNKNVVQNTEGFSKSTFTLTFITEIIGLDVWHDCNEGWLDLGTCYQAMKIQYQLYPGQYFDVDILIWPHVVKVWCGMQYGWARTWQFLERRWFAFSIRHAFPVRVVDFRSHIATITPIFGFGSLGTNAKNDKNVEVYLPVLRFGERRYFAGAIESEQSVDVFLKDVIWSSIIKYIPSSYLDGPFDSPEVVGDIRHQDAVIAKVQEAVLYRSIPEEEVIEPEEVFKPRDRRDSKFPKEKEKEKKKIAEAPKLKFELKLTGDSILAAAGRITQFETVGDRPAELGEIIVLISSNNLPANDDLPIVFVNLENLSDIPTAEFKKARISQLYTRWKIGNEVHESEKQQIKNKKRMNFNDHHTVLLENSLASNTISTFLDNQFVIEIRGKQIPLNINDSSFFGENKITSQYTNDPQDYLIAVVKIDASVLSKRINTLVRGDFPLYPPESTIKNLDREDICTNDMNGIRKSLKPEIIIQPSIILRAQMTLEVSMGFVGCKPKELSLSFSRLYCFVDDSNTVIAIVRKITEINDEVLANSERDNLLTGFVLDVGDKAILYVEGRRHGPILKLWQMAEIFYSSMKTLFSSSSNYSTRLYPDLVSAPMPFRVLKMYVPLSILLACPQVYVRPTLPLPTRSAMLKIGRLVANELRTTPCRNEMPTCAELNSFRLELCSPPRPCYTFQDINLVPNVSQHRNEMLKNFT